MIVRFHDIDIPPYGAKTMRRYNRRTTMPPKEQIKRGVKDGDYPRILVKNEDLDVDSELRTMRGQGLWTMHHLAYISDETAKKPVRTDEYHENKVYGEYETKKCKICSGKGKGWSAGSYEDFVRITGKEDKEPKRDDAIFRIELPDSEQECEFCGGTGERTNWRGAYSSVKLYCFPVSWTFDECTQFLTDEQEKEDTRRANREAAKKAKKEAEIRDAQNYNNKALIDACGMTLDEIAESNERSTFIQDVCSKGMTRKLSEKQINALANSVKKQREFKVANARYAKTATEVPEGRQEVAGTIKSVKWKENQYGGAYKMLVETDTYKVYGSVPSSIVKQVGLTSDLVGQTIRFTATLSAKEIGFGFFSRPSNASLE